jgi:hypothetical protein
MSTVVNSKAGLVKEEFTKEQIEKELKSWIGGDCWGLLVNDEVIFDSYNKKKPLLEDIKDELIRDKLLKSTHTVLLRPIYRTHKDATIVFYMFHTNTWKVEFSYNATTKLWTSKKFVSDYEVERVGYSKDDE